MEENEYRPKFSQWLLLHALPAVVLLLAGAALILFLAHSLKKEPDAGETQKVLPKIEAIAVQPQPVRVVVESQGTVEARTRTTLLAEVSGRVESVAPALYAGGFFKKGDTLATIDDTDYRSNLAAARSRSADAELAYQQEQALAEQAREDWTALGTSESPSALVLRTPQLERALANLDAARAAAKSAERDLQRTVVKAPYDGRVHQKLIDLGQFANARTSPIASIYSIDTAEIRLGISLENTGLVNLPERFSDSAANGHKPKVAILATYGGEDYTWTGVIDRSEGAVDPQTRLLYLVAQIENPYSQAQGSQRPPLKIGSFVRAEIQGQLIKAAFVIPRSALRENDTVYLVDKDNRLEIRKVQPLQKTRDIVILRDGLSPGELLCTSPLQFVVNGMEVALQTAKDPAEKTTLESL